MKSLKKSTPLSSLLIVCFLLVNLNAKAQANKTLDSFRIAFYNVENLFDTLNNPAINDEDFLPSGSLQWNAERYATKLQRIEQVVEALAFPLALGLCEVENRAVVEDILKQPKLKTQNYGIVHFDSPDERGIDVAFLYKKDLLNVKTSLAHRITFPEDPKDLTRDILEVTGTLRDGQKVAFFINHFPSRGGGQAESEPKRIHTAKILRAKIDSILKMDKNVLVTAMGDFNDEPQNVSMSQNLGAQDPSVVKSYDKKKLYNLGFPIKKRKEGTHYYQKEWGLLDQMVVSGGWLLPRSRWYAAPEERILRADFLFFTDKKTNEKMPNRTYTGPKYRGGYSDHLPIYMTIYRR